MTTKKPTMEQRMKRVERRTDILKDTLPYLLLFSILISLFIVLGYWAIVSGPAFSSVEARLDAMPEWEFECVDWIIAAYTTQLIVDGEPTNVAIITDYGNRTFEEAEKALVGMKIISDAFPDQSGQQIDGLKKTCIKEQPFRRPR